MASVLDNALQHSVRAPVQFALRTGETPVTLVGRPGEAQVQATGAFEWRDIVVADARPIADRLDLDRHGFVLRRYDTAVVDFYDEAEVRRVYYPEMERLVRAETGASKVIVFDHTIRNDDAATQAAKGLRAPVSIVHNDFTINSAAQRVRDLVPAGEAAARLGKRYGSINVWRPIRGPVENKPLAICEYDAIDDADLVPAERRYGDRIGGIYHLAYNPAQRWYYFPRMTREEVVVLKCFDTLTDGTARWTAHGSFADPEAPAGARPRESIEIRTLYFFD